MAKKKLTIGELAIMVKKGFDQTATKEDLRLLEQKMDDGFRAVNKRIDLLHEDISDLPDMRETLTEYGKRLDRVERKVGLTR